MLLSPVLLNPVNPVALLWLKKVTDDSVGMIRANLSMGRSNDSQIISKLKDVDGPFVMGHPMI